MFWRFSKIRNELPNILLYDDDIMITTRVVITIHTPLSVGEGEDV